MRGPIMKKTNVLAVLVVGTAVIGMGIAPSAAAVPGLASFVGKWEGHERNLVIGRGTRGHRGLHADIRLKRRGHRTCRRQLR